MNERFGRSEDTKPIKHNDGKPAKVPQPLPYEDDEEDGDIATPKRDRDDEAGE